MTTLTIKQRTKGMKRFTDGANTFTIVDKSDDPYQREIPVGQVQQPIQTGRLEPKRRKK